MKWKDELARALSDNEALRSLKNTAQGERDAALRAKSVAEANAANEANLRRDAEAELRRTQRALVAALIGR